VSAIAATSSLLVYTLDKAVYPGSPRRFARHAVCCHTALSKWQGKSGGGAVVEKEQDHEQLDGAGAEVLRAFCALADDVLPHLSPAEQVLYLRLFRLSHARRSPFAKCRYEDLATQSGLSLRTLQRALKGLKQKQADGDPSAFADEVLRDKVDELVFREVFGVERRERYQHLFAHIYIGVQAV